MRKIILLILALIFAQILVSLEVHELVKTGEQDQIKYYLKENLSIL